MPLGTPTAARSATPLFSMRVSGTAIVLVGEDDLHVVVVLHRVPVAHGRSGPAARRDRTSVSRCRREISTPWSWAVPAPVIPGESVDIDSPSPQPTRRRQEVASDRRQRGAEQRGDDAAAISLGAPTPALHESISSVRSVRDHRFPLRRCRLVRAVVQVEPADSSNGFAGPVATADPRGNPTRDGGGWCKKTSLARPGTSCVPAALPPEPAVVAEQRGVGPVGWASQSRETPVLAAPMPEEMGKDRDRGCARSPARGRDRIRRARGEQRPSPPPPARFRSSSHSDRLNATRARRIAATKTRCREHERLLLRQRRPDRTSCGLNPAIRAAPGRILRRPLEIVEDLEPRVGKRSEPRLQAGTASTSPWWTLIGVDDRDLADREAEQVRPRRAAP